MASQPSSLGQSFQDLTISGTARVHAGNVYNTFAQPADREEYPPEPLSTTPFPRDPDYVHRKSIEDEMHTKLSVNAARVALVGLGGLG